MFSKIQIALDGSSFAEQALPIAESLCQKFDASLEIVSVHEPVVGVEMDGWDQSAATWTEEYVAQVQAAAAERCGQSVNAEMLFGTPVRALVSHAGRAGVDLMVAATHGRGVLSRAWLGSVADGLLRHSDRPLLLVRPEEEDDASLEINWDSILVPVDGTALASAVLDMAIGLARAFNARIELVRVVPLPVEIASPYLPTTVQMNQAVVDGARKEAAAWLESEAARVRGRGIEVGTHVTVSTQPARAISVVAEEAGAGVIVMATHGRKGLERAFLGSTADKVVRSTHLPVLVHRPAIGD